MLTLAPELDWVADHDTQRAESITHLFAITPTRRGYRLEVHGRFLPDRPLARLDAEEAGLLRAVAAEFAGLFGTGDDVARLGLALRLATAATSRLAP